MTDEPKKEESPLAGNKIILNAPLSFEAVQRLMRLEVALEHIEATHPELSPEQTLKTALRLVQEMEKAPE